VVDVVQPTKEDIEKVVTGVTKAPVAEGVLKWAGHVVHQIRYLFREVIRAGLEKESGLLHTTAATPPDFLANQVIQRQAWMAGHVAEVPQLLKALTIKGAARIKEGAEGNLNLYGDAERVVRQHIDLT